jgi:hypothetical protein
MTHVLLVLFFCFSFFSEGNLYSEKLPITEQQSEDIHKLILTLANTGTMGLMFKKGELEEIGSRINGIHPLRYLGCIYSDPKLKQCMPKILGKSMVAGRFVSELSAGLNEKMDEGQLVQYVPGFAEDVHVDAQALMPFVNSRNWRGMLEYLNTH